MLHQTNIKKAFKDTLDSIRIAMYTHGYAIAKVDIAQPVSLSEWDLFKTCFSRMVESMHLVCTLVLLDNNETNEIRSFGIDIGYP